MNEAKSSYYVMAYTQSATLPILSDTVMCTEQTATDMAIEINKQSVPNNILLIVSTNLPEKYLILHDNGLYEYSEGA